MTRKPGFDLAAELAKPGFTPAQRDAPALVDLVAAADEAVASRAAPALASLKDVARRAIAERLAAPRVEIARVEDGLPAYGARVDAGAKPSIDASAKPPVDAGAKSPVDAGMPAYGARVDAGAKPPVDAGAKPPIDAGAKPPVDAGAKSPVDAGAKSPVDAGMPAYGARVDAGAKPPVDAGAKPPVDAGAKPPIDAGAKPPVDAAAKPPVDAGAKSPVDAGAKPPADASAKPPVDAAAKPRVDTGAKLPFDAGAQARLVGVIGLLAKAGDGDARAMLFERMGDAEVRVRRAAASALGKLEGDDVRHALLARWDASDVTADERRVLVEALGKLGGGDVLVRLRALEPGVDVELARRRDRAMLMADRSAKRDEDSAVVADVAPPAPVIVRLGCRAGLAELLVEELAAIGITARALVDREVEFEFAKPLSTLFGSHLWATLAVRMPFDASGDLAASLTRAITARPVRDLLRAWTRGPIRWRLGFASGHKRSIVWRVARDVTAAAPELVNDPTATTWDILVDETSPAAADSRTTDSRTTDSRTADSRTADSRTADSRTADSRTADSRTTDSRTSDSRTADSRTADSRTADLRTGDSALAGSPTAYLSLAPRRLDDPRFAWRVAEIPAGSHPSVAAALVWLAGLRDDDRVWDPFCGSGLELVERAERGPYGRLVGSDIDEAALVAARANADAARANADAARANADAARALVDVARANADAARANADAARANADAARANTDAARANADAARANADTAVKGGGSARGPEIELVRGDARNYAPGPVDLIITNPPLGSRVQLDAVGLLADALPNFVKQLAPKGRLVWITPATRKTSPACEQLGLRRTRWMHVDLGGVRGHLERWEKP